MSNVEEKSFARVVAIAAVVITIIALYFIMTASIPQKPLAGQGNIASGKADIGGEFNLIDQEGKSFSSFHLHGKLAIIYFGFTFCPDICPTSLQKISSVLEKLDKYGIEVTPIFITIDPKRDTSESLKAYLKHFHKKFIGLTGSEKMIKDAANKFKVYYALAPGSDFKSKDYLLDHTSFVYLMDKNGNYMTHFHIDSNQSEIIEYIRIHQND